MKIAKVWSWVAVLGAAVLLAPVTRMAAEEGAAPEKKEEKGEGRRGNRGGFNLYTVETIQEKLGTGEGMALSDEQKTKINTLRDELKKKMEDKLVAAKEKIDAAQDEAAKKAARREAMGDFKMLDEFKNGLKGILSEGQFGKLYAAKTGEHKTGEHKTEEAKTEAPKDENMK